MANLVTVTKDSRIILKAGGIFAGILLLIYIVVQGGVLFRAFFFPKPPPVPKEALGKLPNITFPTQGQPGIEFKVNTVNGDLPTLPDRVNVYRLKKPEPNLLALEEAKNTIDSVNFASNQTKLTSTLYQWSQPETGAVMQYDIVTKNFSITSNYLSNPLLASSKLMPSEDVIKTDMRNFLQGMKSNIDNLDFDKSKVEFLELNNGGLIPAQNLGNAKFAKVTLVQKNVDEIPFIYDTPTDSILTFIISYPGRFQVVEGKFFNHDPDTEQKSDYPIKSSDQALEDLKKGNGYMINPQNLTSVDITNVELKYYLNKESSEFLLPVIVFTGINFTAYVEAVQPTSTAN